MRFALVTCMKNEGPFVLEFVAHHLAVGFTDIYIASNPSDDGTNELLAALHRAHIISHIEVATPKGKLHQPYAMSRLIDTIDLDAIDWLMVLDADELLNIHVGNRDIPSLVGFIPDCIDVVSINWACFGNYPHRSWTDDAASDRFVYRLNSNDASNAAGKSLIRNPGRFKAFGNHGPSGFTENRSVRIALHAGLSEVAISDNEELVRKLRTPGSGLLVHSIAQINHYLIRTLDSYRLRIQRGRGMQMSGKPDTRHTPNYFMAAAKARTVDKTILGYRRKRRVIEINLLQNDSIRSCYRNAIGIYETKIERLGEI